MITTTNLKKVFGRGDTQVRAIDQIALSVETGELVAIIGKSGSGKSTLLALLGGLDVPTEGTIDVDGKTVTKFGERDLLKYRLSTVGFVFQNYNLVPNLSALDNVILPMEFAGVAKKKRHDRAMKLLAQVGIEGNKLNRRPGKLSGGEQQRVAIARALANKPKLVLADEPTGNLDTQTGTMIIELLHHLAKSEQTTVITVTHDHGIAKQADHVFELIDGRIKMKS